MAAELERQGKWSEALKIVEEAIALRENLGERRFIINDYLRLGRILSRFGRYDGSI
ncbi:MAG: tetratricopeptide repeat protein [Candidatus Edwardsbacteria bacterium]